MNVDPTIVPLKTPLPHLPRANHGVLVALRRKMEPEVLQTSHGLNECI